MTFFPYNIDWPKVLTEAVRDGVHASELARRMGVGTATVCRASARHAILLPRGPNYKPEHPAVADWPAALLKAREDGLTVTETAKALNVSAAAVTKNTQRHGIYLRGQKSAPRELRRVA